MLDGIDGSLFRHDKDGRVESAIEEMLIQVWIDIDANRNRYFLLCICLLYLLVLSVYFITNKH